MIKVKQIVKYIFGNEKRQKFTVPLFAIFCALFVVSVILIIMGNNPFAAFHAVLAGAGILPRPGYAAGRGMFTDMMLTLSELTPMIFASLAVIIALKGGLFNIGISGQMLLSGFTATVFVGYSSLNAYIAMPLVLIIGALSGAAAGWFVGFLKSKFNVNEVVSTIMLNYIIMLVITFFITTRYLDPVTRQSREVNSSARLVLQGVEIGQYKTVLPVFVLLAVAAVFAVRFFINRTRIGFDILAVGSNSRAARYIGISPSLNIMLAMTISGALAGLAGVTYYLGYYGSIALRELPSMGFESIAVALLGNASPIGALFAAMLITVISRGSTYLSSALGVTREISQVTTGLILLFSACGAYFKGLINKED